MPRKKVSTRRLTKKTIKKPVRSTRATRSTKRPSRETIKQNKINWTESYSSFLLGVVVIIVAVLFGVSIIRQQSHIKQTSSISTRPTATTTPSTTGKKYYIVKPNDSLWTIAVAVYNNGYKWVDIARANNITSPDYIFTGDKLLLPNTPKPSKLGQIMQKTPSDKVVGTTYIVQKDDSLWSIAVRAYGDGYQWIKIARANNLSNPDLIFSGNVLTLPR